MTTPYFVTQQTQLYLMNKTVSPFVAVVAASLQGFQGLSGMKSIIKTTNFDSLGYEEFAPGLVDPGKPSGNVVFDFNSAAHQLLHKLVGSGQGSETQFFYGAADGTAPPTVVASVLTPPNAVASPHTYTRSGFLFDGFVAEFSYSMQVNNIILAKLTMQATGAIKMIVKGGLTPIF